jgi:hypothetical protein
MHNNGETKGFVTLAIYMKIVCILRQMKNYAKTQIFHHAKNIIFKKSFTKKNQNPFKIL